MVSENMKQKEKGEREISVLRTSPASWKSPALLPAVDKSSTQGLREMPLELFWILCKGKSEWTQVKNTSRGNGPPLAQKNGCLLVSRFYT